MSKKVIGIYLAAGRSTRFKQNKLTAFVQGRFLGGIALEEALQSSLDHIVVVTHPDDLLTWLPKNLKQEEKGRLFFTTSHHQKTGQAYSLRQGLDKARTINEEAAIMVLLADQPFITKQVLNFMIQVYIQKEDYTCIGLNYTHISPPLIISSDLFDEISQLTGDEGARKIIEKHYKKSLFLPVTNDKIFIDIDTQADFNKWKDSL